MSKRTMKELSSILSMAVLLVGLPAAAVGQPAAKQQAAVWSEVAIDEADSDSGATLGLGLEATPIAEELGWVPLDESETTADATAEPSLASLHAAPPNYAAVEPAIQSSVDPGSGEKKGGFGRWIKKHWYVAAIVAIGLGYVIADDGSDADEEED